MNPISYIFAVVAATVALVVIVDMLRRQKFRERHAFWWLIAAVLSVLITVFPVTLEWAAAAVGVEVPSNLAFFVSILILFFVTVQHGSELTVLEEKTRQLAEHTALMELKIQRLEAETHRRHDSE